MMIGFGSDHAGYQEKQELQQYVQQELGHDTEDFGPSSDEACDYPDYAHPLAESVSDGECDRGVLICGTSAGMVMTANKHPGVRAFSCTDEYIAEMSRRHTKSNVICFGARRQRLADFKRWLQKWLKTPFDGGRHERRVEKIRPGDDY